MIIRKAGESDIISIHELDRESTKYHEKFDADFYDISEKWWKEKKLSQLSAVRSKRNAIFVAEEKGRIEGYVWGFIEKLGKYKIGKIQELSVSSRSRKRGTGTKLIEKIVDFFRKNGCIICETMTDARNKPAINLYEKSGFEKVGYRMWLKIDSKRRFRPFY